MPAWIHGRAEHLLAKNPSMKKETAFAIATQQGHRLGKNPKGYGTATGKRVAKRKFDKPKKEYVKTPNPRELESPKMAAMRRELEKGATTQSDSPYMLDKLHVEPKVRPRRADAPEPKHRVKLAVPAPGMPAPGGQVAGVFGLSPQTGQTAGLNPAKQLGQMGQPQNTGAPKLPAPKMPGLSMKTAFAVSQYSGTLGGGRRDIYTTGEFKTAGPPGEKGSKKKSKVAAMRDELAKLNGVAITPKGKLRQTQSVGAPKVTPPPGPSIAELSKPVGYGMKAPGATKGTI